MTVLFDRTVHGLLDSRVRRAGRGGAQSRDGTVVRALGQTEDVKIGAVIDVVDGPALIPGAGEVQ